MPECSEMNKERSPLLSFESLVAVKGNLDKKIAENLYFVGNIRFIGGRKEAGFHWFSTVS